MRTSFALSIMSLSAALALGAVSRLPAAPGDSAAPTFTSATEAGAWADAQEQAGRYDLASQGYAQEAVLRGQAGDAQDAELDRRRATDDATSLVIGVPGPERDVPSAAGALAKLEPRSGCLLGTLDSPGEGRSFRGEASVDDFQRRIGRPVAVAFRYVRYGQPFPFAWAHAQAQAGRAIELAMEPYDIYGVTDDEYLEGFAADLKQSGAKCFLRFGGEMNGDWVPWGKDPAGYKHAFRVVHDVMARFAPTCAMVWAPNMMPLSEADKYYPGDDVVDWVGLSFYMVKYYDNNRSSPASQDEPETFLDPFYKQYAARKPVCLVEAGVTRQSAADDGATSDDFAAARIADLLSAVKLRYPRIKMVCWFDRNTLAGGDSDRRSNDYSLPYGSEALATFARAVSDPYFLARVPADAGTGADGAVAPSQAALTAPATDAGVGAGAAPSDPAASDPLLVSESVADPAPLPLTSYQTLGSSLPAGYVGPLSVSLATYSLQPVVTVTRDGVAEKVARPYDFALPSGSGPVTIAVHDDAGRLIDTRTLVAPPGDPVKLASAATPAPPPAVVSDQLASPAWPVPRPAVAPPPPPPIIAAPVQVASVPPRVQPALIPRPPRVFRGAVGPAPAPQLFQGVGAYSSPPRQPDDY